MTEQEKEAEVEKKEGDGKKKKRVIVTPPCPPAAATGYLILRGALQGLVGGSMDEASVSLMQPTYIKENVPSGKFSINLGKKLGSCALDLPDTPEGQDALFLALKTALQRIIDANTAITCFTMPKDEALEKYGEGILNQVILKKTPDPLTLAFIDGVVLAVPPSMPFFSTGAIQSIELDLSQCNVMAGKKARKADITVKFEVKEKAEGAQEAVLSDSPVPADAVATLRTNTIRLEEGKVLEAASKEEEEKKVEAPQEEAAPTDPSASVVNPWEVTGKVDYNKLIDQFGSTPIDDELMKRLEAIVIAKGKVSCLHRFLRREIFFSHRDMNPLLDCMEKGTPMYLYTGRGPSSTAMHLGHLVPFLFTKWLQDAFDVPLVIQMTDDEKFIFKGEYTAETGDNLDRFAKLTLENARDIIACGFDFDKTFIFSDLDYVGRMYPNIVRIWKAVTTNTVNGIFGFDGSSNIGKIAFPAIQAAPSFASSFPIVLDAKSHREAQHCCLIPCAIDQDPYFRMTRDIANKLSPPDHGLGGKPALIHSKFFPPLQGAAGKMSSSDENSAVFLTDTPEEIERKIKSFAFSGGGDTMELQKEHGADLELDVSYQWLRFFLDDDKELEKIGKDYGSGSGEYWSTTAVKKRLVEVLQDLVAAHQERRAKITDEDVEKWMSERCILVDKSS